MRLIDADRLKSYIDCGHLRPPTEVCFSELDVCNMIDKAPTVSAEASQNLAKPIKALKGSDLISREVVLANINERLKANGYGNVGLVSELNRLIGYVRNIPSADAEWIPCSERLPEKDELVLVTVWNGVSIAWRNIYGGWESAEDMYEKGDVTAWMPLPTPYKGGDTE